MAVVAPTNILYKRRADDSQPSSQPASQSETRSCRRVLYPMPNQIGYGARKQHDNKASDVLDFVISKLAESILRPDLLAATRSWKHGLLYWLDFVLNHYIQGQWDLLVLFVSVEHA